MSKWLSHLVTDPHFHLFFYCTCSSRTSCYCLSHPLPFQFQLSFGFSATIPAGPGNVSKLPFCSLSSSEPLEYILYVLALGHELSGQPSWPPDIHIFLSIWMNRSYTWRHSTLKNCQLSWMRQITLGKVIPIFQTSQYLFFQSNKQPSSHSRSLLNLYPSNIY